MRSHALIRRACLGATGGLVAASVVMTAPAAHAAPVFTAATFSINSFAHDDASCTESLAVEQPPANTPLVENGPGSRPGRRRA